MYKAMHALPVKIIELTAVRTRFRVDTIGYYVIKDINFVPRTETEKK